MGDRCQERVSVSTSRRSRGQRAAASRTGSAFLKVTTPLKEREAPRSRQRRASSGPPVKQWMIVRSGTPTDVRMSYVSSRPPGCGPPGSVPAGGPARPAGRTPRVGRAGANGRSGSRGRTPRLPRPPAPARARVEVRRPVPGQLGGPPGRRGSRPVDGVMGMEADGRPHLDALGHRQPIPDSAWPGPDRRLPPSCRPRVPTQTILVTPASDARPGSPPAAWRAVPCPPPPRRRRTRRTPLGGGSGSRTTRRRRRPPGPLGLAAREERGALLDGQPARIAAPGAVAGQSSVPGRALESDPAPDLRGRGRHGRRDQDGHEAQDLEGAAQHGVHGRARSAFHGSAVSSSALVSRSAATSLRARGGAVPRSTPRWPRPSWVAATPARRLAGSGDGPIPPHLEPTTVVTRDSRLPRLLARSALYRLA